MSSKEILDFLQEKPGYRNEGKRRLQSVLQNRGYDVTLEDCAEALRDFKLNDTPADHVFNSTAALTEDVDKIPAGFKVKSMWQSAGGKMLYSYEKAYDPQQESHLDAAVAKLAKYHKNRPTSSNVFTFNTSEKGSGIKVHSLADLHIGAYIRNLINTPDYDATIIVEKLTTVADEINAENNAENHIFILGDLIESFTGLNHINSWKSLELHGANALIIAYEILTGFLERIENLHTVYLIAGNHDRITSNNKEDQDGDVAKVIGYFLSNKFNLVFHSRVISVVIDNINYILHHGDKSFAKGDIADIILAHKKGDCFTVVLSGHLHTRGKKERETQILADDKKYRAYINPSIFTGNQYSEDLGFTSVAGYYTFENRNNLPRLLDNPLV